MDVCSVGTFVSFLTELKILCEVGAEAKEDEEEGRQDFHCLTFFPVLNEIPAVTEGPPSPLTPKPCSHTQDCHDIRIILQELHPGEEVLCVCLVKNNMPPSHHLLIFTIIII